MRAGWWRQFRARHGLGDGIPLRGCVRARLDVGGSFEAARLALDGSASRSIRPAAPSRPARPRASATSTIRSSRSSASSTAGSSGSPMIDAHRIDGVERFAKRSRVWTISIHEAGRWPGTGAARSPRGQGATRRCRAASSIPNTISLIAGDSPRPRAAEAGCRHLRRRSLLGSSVEHAPLNGAVAGGDGVIAGRRARSCSAAAATIPWTLALLGRAHGRARRACRRSRAPGSRRSTAVVGRRTAIPGLWSICRAEGAGSRRDSGHRGCDPGRLRKCEPIKRKLRDPGQLARMVQGSSRCVGR